MLKKNTAKFFEYADTMCFEANEPAVSRKLILSYIFHNSI